jgi:hypothetical protein
MPGTTRLEACTGHGTSDMSDLEKRLRAFRRRGGLTKRNLVEMRRADLAGRMPADSRRVHALTMASGVASLSALRALSLHCGAGDMSDPANRSEAALARLCAPTTWCRRGAGTARI